MRPFLLLSVLGALALGTTPARACHHPYHLQMVDCWYRYYLHRPLDCCGADLWCKQIACGTPTDTVLARILGSQEYYCRHGGTPCGYITGLFCEMVGRHPCPAELHYWQCRLGACGCRAKLAGEFLCAFRKGLLGGTPTPPAPNEPPPPPVIVPAAPTLPSPTPVRPGEGYYPPVPGYGPATPAPPSP
jgi:hypothetical protein